MRPTSLTSAAIHEINEHLSAAISLDAHQAKEPSQHGRPTVYANPPGIHFLAVNSGGPLAPSFCHGKHAFTGPGAAKPITDDSSFFVLSCGKLVASIACMQLVERGSIKLDDKDWLLEWMPELRTIGVLKRVQSDAQDTSGHDLIVEPREGDITVRMLLTHTAGFGLSVFNEELRDYTRPFGFDEFSCTAEDLLSLPLVNHPGTRFEYGYTIDWIGILIERITNMKLGDYYAENILKPISATDINFLPTPAMRAEQVTFVQRDPATSLCIERDHPNHRAISPRTKNSDIFHMAGVGLYARPVEFGKILSTLLNNGMSPTTGQRILKKATVDEMFTNQLPQFPDLGRQIVPAAKPWITNATQDLYPQAGNPPQGWGLSFMLTLEEGPTGRGKGTAWWGGASNTFWWLDRAKGVGGIISAQLFPFGDPVIGKTWFIVEKEVYDGLVYDEAEEKHDEGV